ncbi:hypothetical protein V1291_005678 [Nitrobacteraceae bacterium AZCC 1564]
MRTLFVALAFTAVLSQTPASAAQEDDKVQTKLCDHILNSVTEAIQAGDMQRAQRNKPSLERCLKHHKAKLVEEARKLVDQSRAAIQKLESENLR